jgi:hypothetical protein
MNILTQLQKWSVPTPITPELPTQEHIISLENYLTLTLPDSYKMYLLNYSNLSIGTFELYLPIADNSYLDIYEAIKEARAMGLPKYLVPFLGDNNYYYCFDTQKRTTTDYEVVVWNNGLTGEKWINFLEWVEHCWLAETKKMSKS